MIGNKYPSHTVMDVRIHAVTMEEALRCAREMAASGEEHIIATANAEMVMIAQEDKELAYVLNHCSLVVPDGAGILWAGEQLGTYFPARVAGADYAEEILKIAVKEKWPVYFLGGAPGVAETAIRRNDTVSLKKRDFMMAISMKWKNRKSWKKLNPAVPKSFYVEWECLNRKNGCGTIRRN